LKTDKKNRVVKKFHSLYGELIALICMSAVIAFITFFSILTVSNIAVDKFYSETNYITRKNESKIKELKQYIKETNLKSTDKKKIKAWRKDNHIAWLLVFRGDEIKFDSDPQDDYEDDAISLDDLSESYYTVTFADGDAEVLINAVNTEVAYVYSIVGAIAVSVLIFFLVIMTGLRRKMRYVSKLSKEIGILESGDLNYSITIKGDDEVTRVAESLEDMRKSFKNQIEQENYAVEINKKLVTEMSHDLRTPLTSLLMYSELLKMHKYPEGKLDDYLNKIDNKAKQIKRMTDNMFEYSLVSSNSVVELEEPCDFKMIFYDMISEFAGSLESQGFKCDLRVKWPEVEVKINTDYILRVLDNISSNMIKYADPEYDIMIEEGTREDDSTAKKYVGIAFENRIKSDTEKIESTHIGLQSIDNMMKAMFGYSDVAVDGDKYRITIYLPIEE
jgi:signal transduction histidine kinase